MKRIKKVILVCLALFLATAVYAATRMDLTPIPVNREYITVNTSVGLTASKYYSATAGVLADSAWIAISPNSGGIYYNLAGATATSQDPQRFPSQGIWLDNYQQVSNFRAVKSGSTNAGLSVIYYKWRQQ